LSGRERLRPRVPRSRLQRRGQLPILGAAARKAIDQSDDLGDLDTADLFTEVSRGIDKWLWFVEAHLQAER
jgi:starvation-inducible DNA-binding protein